ncbi:MAG: PH domain-containing protein [Planctomycetia bacterium]|nr:PH domain-containing protein [Planctomycetia bacterium]
MSDAFHEKMSEFRSGAELEAPTETFIWRYSVRDLLDETIILVILLAVFAGICMYFQSSWIWGLMIIPVVYGIWLAYTFFARRLCTEYRLTPQNFIHQKGFLVQKTIYIELFDVEQVNLKRNLWERIIGVGTICLRVKHQSSENDNSENQKIGRNFQEIKIPGMTDFENIREKIDSYRLYVRQKRGIMTSS